VLDAIVAERGQPRAIRCDNGPELTSRHFLAWCVERQIELVHIQPGKPTQNAHVESFHGRLREECLRVSWAMRSIWVELVKRSCALFGTARDTYWSKELSLHYGIASGVHSA